MPAVRLYFDDPHQTSFHGVVRAHGVHGGRPSVILDETAFYPEAGGQMADRGTLAGLAVVDVQEDDAGEVHHVVEGALPPVGARVAGEVLRARRRVHMALHSGQHMLSRALLDVAAAETVSSRLGETECTIDLGKEKLTDDELHRAEDLVNAVIDDDVAVRAYFPTPDELRALPLRRAPKVTDNVRVVEFAGFDVSPCGGTHVTGTAQVGLVRVEKVERKKGLSRVTFTAGARARGALFDEDRALRALASRFSCGVLDVDTAVEKLSRELKDARTAFSRVQGQLAQRTKDALEAALAREERALVVEVFDDVDVGFLRAVAQALAVGPRAVVLAGRGADGMHVLVMRGPQSAVDAGKLLAAIAQRAGGKGGGKSDLAQGRIPLVDDLAALVDAARTDG